MARVWLGLGGNIGDVAAQMKQALAVLAADGNVSITKVSPVYKTPPWGVEDQPWFLNCCVEIETALAPEALLELCQEAERMGKRERVVRWGPRTIDVDILIFDGVEQTEQRLTIPHPRMLERSFVLVPLRDIAPELMIAGTTIREHAAKLGQEGVEPADLASDWWR